MFGNSATIYVLMEKPKTPLFGRFIKRGTTRTVFLVGPIAIKAVPVLRLLRMAIARAFKILFSRKPPAMGLFRWLKTMYADIFIASCVANLSERYVSIRCPILSAERDGGYGRGFRIAKTYLSLFGLVNVQRRIRGSRPDYKQIMDALRSVGSEWHEKPDLLLQLVGQHAFDKCNWMQSPDCSIIALIDYGDAPKMNQDTSVAWVIGAAEFSLWHKRFQAAAQSENSA